MHFNNQANHNFWILNKQGLGKLGSSTIGWVEFGHSELQECSQYIDPRHLACVHTNQTRHKNTFNYRL